MTVTISIIIGIDAGVVPVIVVITISVILRVLIEYKGASRTHTDEDDTIIRAILRVVSILASDINMTLRAHIAWMDLDGFLRIKYHYGMDKDPDRYIELRSGQGCMGQTWAHVEQNYKIDGTFANLKEAAEKGDPDWNMPAAQQALVKKGLCWIFTFPIFAQEEVGVSIIGLLTIDSNDALDIKNDELIVKKIEDFIGTLASIYGAILPALTNIPRGTRRQI